MSGGGGRWFHQLQRPPSKLRSTSGNLGSMVSPGALGGSLRVVCFELRGQELALPIADVRETLPVLPVTAWSS